MKITTKKFTQTPGIYVWTNTVNGKVYVGQSVNVCRRVQGELKMLRNGNFHNEHMQRAWDKYGEDAFIVGQVMECEVYELNDAEAAWGTHFDALNPEHGYNIRDYGNGKMADETKQKIADAWTDEMKAAQAEFVSQANIARYGYDEIADDIIKYFNMGLHYAEIKKLTGASACVVHRVVSQNPNLVENITLTKVEAYEAFNAGIITAKKAAALGGFKSVKFFNKCYAKWMAEN